MYKQSFIESFVKYCEGSPTPALFAKWSAIACLSGATERRVFAITRNTRLIPNTIILLVSPPGIGKTRVISEVHEMWIAAGCFNVSPTTVTRAALIDQLAEKKFLRQIKKNGIITGDIIEYHSVLVASPEFGVFVPKHDLEFLNTINDLFDCRTNFVERRRGLKETIQIPKPHLSIIAGTQPSYLGELLPDAAYGMGFTARCIMIYQGQGPSVPIFGPPTERKDFRTLVSFLKEVSELYGQVTWTLEVQKELQEWVSNKMLPAPTHSRLLNYNTRRDLHLLKLCMIRAVSFLRLNIVLEDYLWAKATLLEAETYMNDIFREMVCGSDTMVLQETVSFIKEIFEKENKPVSQGRLVSFLTARVPSQKVLEIIQIMVKGEMIKEFAHATGLRFYTPPDRGK